MINAARILCACALAALTGCATANSEAFVPFDVMVSGSAPERVVLVTEDTSILPYRSAADSTGVSMEQVDLATNHNVMVGFNEAYISGYRLGDNGMPWDKSGQGVARTRFEMASAPGAFDYALTTFYRTNGTVLDNQCFYENALVFRLKPGVVNYIPKELQPPLYHGQPTPDVATLDLAELRRVLAVHPIGSLSIAIPDIVAIVKFKPDGLALGQECAYSNDFTVLQRFDTAAPARAN